MKAGPTLLLQKLAFSVMAFYSFFTFPPNNERFLRSFGLLAVANLFSTHFGPTFCIVLCNQVTEFKTNYMYHQSQW